MASNTERLKDDICITVTNLMKLRLINDMLRDLTPDGVIITKKELASIVTIISNRMNQYEREVDKLWPKTS